MCIVDWLYYEQEKQVDYYREYLVFLLLLLYSRIYSRILTHHFINLSIEIETLFPSENRNTYYIPFRQVSSTDQKIKVLAKGMLWSKYNNEKYRMKKILQEANVPSEGNYYFHVIIFCVSNFLLLNRFICSFSAICSSRIYFLFLFFSYLFLSYSSRRIII